MSADTFRTEFNDLWHSLKVPNDVDLLKQLASGTSSFLSPSPFHFLFIFWFSPADHESNRGSASDNGRGTCTQGTHREEERQARRSVETPTSADYEYTFERRNRFIEPLCRSWEVMIGVGEHIAKTYDSCILIELFQICGLTLFLNFFGSEPT